MPDSDVIMHDDFGHDPASAGMWRRYLSGRREPERVRACLAERVADQRARIRSATADEHETSPCLVSRESGAAFTRGQNLQSEKVRARVVSARDQVHAVDDSWRVP